MPCGFRTRSSASATRFPVRTMLTCASSWRLGFLRLGSVRMSCVITHNNRCDHMHCQRLSLRATSLGEGLSRCRPTHGLVWGAAAEDFQREAGSAESAVDVDYGQPRTAAGEHRVERDRPALRHPKAN